MKSSKSGCNNRPNGRRAHLFWCPWCGNRNQDTIQDNGDSPSSLDYTLLCLARVDPSKSSFGPAEPDKDGKVTCGMQWNPKNAKPATRLVKEFKRTAPKKRGIRRQRTEDAQRFPMANTPRWTRDGGVLCYDGVPALVVDRYVDDKDRAHLSPMEQDALRERILDHLNAIDLGALVRTYRGRP